MQRREITISVSASEKLNAGQYESLERSVFMSTKFDIDGDLCVDVEKMIAEETARLQMRAEAQCYAALSRAMESRGQRQSWLRDAAVNRASRVETIDAIEDQAKAEKIEPKKGVIS